MTLSELSYYIRKAIPILIIGFLGLMIFVVIIMIFFELISQKKPTETKRIDPAYKVIERDVFTSAQQLPTGVRYRLETIDGVPKASTSEARVFMRKAQNASFDSTQKARLLAKQFGYPDDAHSQVDGYFFTYVDAFRRLVIDVSRFNYHYTMSPFNDEVIDLLQNPAAFLPQDLDKTIVEQHAIEVLKKFGTYPEALSKGSRKVIYHYYDVQTEKSQFATSSAQSNMVEVDFFPDKIDNLEVYPEQYYTSPHHVVYIPARDMPLVSAQVSYFEHQDDEYAVYPLKSPEQAYRELQSGIGHMAGARTISETEVTITSMSLAYIEPLKHSAYLQPYYVFTDGKDFAAYVSAISDVWIKPWKPVDGIHPPALPDQSNSISPSSAP